MCPRFLLIFTGRIFSSPLRCLCVVLCLPFATTVWQTTCLLKALHKKGLGREKKGIPQKGVQKVLESLLGWSPFPCMNSVLVRQGGGIEREKWFSGKGELKRDPQNARKREQE